MKKILYCLFLIGLGVISTMMLLSEKEPEARQVVLQSYSYDRTSDDAILPYYRTQEVIERITAKQKTITVDPETYPENGVPWLISLTDEGSPEVTYQTYESTFNQAGELLSRILVPYSTVVNEARPRTYSYGSVVKEGAYFTSRKATSYGVDCVGCGGEDDGYGGTSVGIQMSTTSVRQSDGTWKEGITYDGYYLIAADKSIPLCTVVEISNHKWSGKGLVRGESFLALVVDRGGAVTGSDIDLFVGSERNSGVKNGSQKGTRVEIVSFGQRARNSLGQKVCKVEPVE